MSFLLELRLAVLIAQQDAEKAACENGNHTYEAEDPLGRLRMGPSGAVAPQPLSEEMRRLGAGWRGVRLGGQRAVDAKSLALDDWMRENRDRGKHTFDFSPSCRSVHNSLSYK